MVQKVANDDEEGDGVVNVSYRVIFLVKHRNRDGSHQPETGKLVLFLLGVLRKNVGKFKTWRFC